MSAADLLVGLPFTEPYAVRRAAMNRIIIRVLVAIVEGVHAPYLATPPLPRGMRFGRPKPSKPRLYSARTRQPLSDADFTQWITILRGSEFVGLGTWHGRDEDVTAVIRGAMRALRVAADPSIN